MDIMSNMDAARFTSANVNNVENKPAEKEQQHEQKEQFKTPMVIRNLNNQ